MQGIALQYRLMFTFDNIKRVIALIFVLLVSVSAEAKKFEYTVSTPEEYYNVFEDIRKVIIGTDDEIYEYIINVTDDLVLSEGFGYIGSSDNCEKYNKIKVKVQGPKEPINGNIKFEGYGHHIFHHDFSFSNIDFEGGKIYFSIHQYHVNFEHCNFNKVEFPNAYISELWTCDESLKSKSKTFKYCTINATSNSKSIVVDTLFHCTVRNLFVGTNIYNDVAKYIAYNTFENDNYQSCTLYIHDYNEEGAPKVIHNVFKNNSTLSLSSGINIYNSNNLFYDNSYIKRSGASHAFRAAIEKDIVSIKGDKLPPSYLVEAFVKNSKGLAVEKIAEGVVDADGNVEIKKNINTLSEELEGISILMSPPLGC